MLLRLNTISAHVDGIQSDRRMRSNILSLEANQQQDQIHSGNLKVKFLSTKTWAVRRGRAVQLGSSLL